jgi:hypothetical protein
MSNIQTRTMHTYLGELNVKLTAEIYDGRTLDTKVEIEAGTLCWICGEQRDEFFMKMNELIKEYRI